MQHLDAQGAVLAQFAPLCCRHRRRSGAFSSSIAISLSVQMAGRRGRAEGAAVCVDAAPQSRVEVDGQSVFPSMSRVLFLCFSQKACAQHGVRQLRS